MIRILTDCLLVVGVILAPWWVVFLLAVLGLFVFSYYAEAVAVALVGDILFGAASVGFPWIGVTMLVLFLLVQVVKVRLRLYER
ncbi:MAG: hypothetical protein WDZ79_01135 [Candidatus Paceibacterota bacterium]